MTAFAPADRPELRRRWIVEVKREGDALPKTISRLRGSPEPRKYTIGGMDAAIFGDYAGALAWARILAKELAEDWVFGGAAISVREITLAAGADVVIYARKERAA